MVDDNATTVPAVTDWTAVLPYGECTRPSRTIPEHHACSSAGTWTAKKIIDDKYRLLECLGTGGMGSVWAARHLTLDATVAVKFMSPSVANDPEAARRFALEARAAAALRSSHVVQVLDYGSSHGVPFIAMELLAGETLAARLVRCKRLSLDETTRIIEQVARAMTRAHSMGIVHRDLKPDNIFIAREDDREIVKVLDFGVAKPEASSEHAIPLHTRSGVLVGTPYYISPEQAEGEKDLDHRTDLWAMGVIAFECLTGKRPFSHQTLGGLIVSICSKPIVVPSRVARVPAGFDRWFAKALARPRSERFDSATGLAQALQRLQSPARPLTRCDTPIALKRGGARLYAFVVACGLLAASMMLSMLW